MEILRGPAGLAPVTGASVVAIGNFDGIHLGHQALVAAVLEATALRGGTATVLTFEPHPREVLARAAHRAVAEVPARLQRLREKVPVLAALGVQRLVVARFNDRLRLQAPAEFVESFLVELLRARHVVVGEGFRFGHRGAGTVDTLREVGARCGFTVQAVPLGSLPCAKRWTLGTCRSPPGCWGAPTPLLRACSVANSWGEPWVTPH